MKIIVLEHERAVPAALLVDWASARGHAVSTLEVPALTRWPVPRDADAFVTLGSDRSVTDPSVPWLERELELLRSAHGAGVPLLGICFGAQALAKALGGEVRRAPQIALDWSTLETDEPELIARGPWLRWHEDILTVPPGARELARSGEVPLAFVHGASIGVQFHPETDAALAHAWIEESQRKLAERAIDEPALRREIALAAPGARARALELFDRIAGLWAQPR
jgi:GMP synthase-like glutamine amidotransferase